MKRVGVATCVGLLAGLSAPVRTTVAATPAIVLQDNDVKRIATVELFRSGLYWWQAGFCCAVPECDNILGSIACRAYQNLRVVKDSSRSGFLPSGVLEAGVYTETPPVTTRRVVPATSCLLGDQVVRDDDYFYYALDRKLCRKSVSLPPEAPGVTIANGSGILAVIVQADGALFIDGEDLWSYYQNANGTMSVSRCRRDSSGHLEEMFMVPGAAVDKFALVDVKIGGPAAVARTSALLLTRDSHRLYLFDVSPRGAAPALVQKDVADFAIRDEWGLNGLYGTTLYVAQASAAPDRGNGVLRWISLTDGSSYEAYNTQSRDQQVTSVAVDRERIFLTQTPLTCTQFGCTLTDQSGQILRRRGAGDFETIVQGLECRSLRSDGQWLYFAHSNSIRKIATDAPATELDIAAIGLEAVQTIQNLNNTIPLVAHKTTIVRAYAKVVKNTTGQKVFFPSGRLQAFRNGVELAGSPIWDDDPPAVGEAPNLASVRSKWDTGYIFEAPKEWMEPGNIQFVFTVNPNRTVPETGPTPLENNRASATVQVLGVGKPALVFVTMSSTLPDYDPKAAGRDFFDILDRATSLLPVPGFKVFFRQGVVHKPVVRILPPGIKSRSYDLPNDKDIALVWLAVTKVFDRLPKEVPSEVHYVGMFPPGGWNGGHGGGAFFEAKYLKDCGFFGDVLGAVGGLLGIRVPVNAWSKSSIVAMSHDAVANAEWNNPRGGTVLAHELGHNFGRLHIKNFAKCGDVPDCPHHPFPTVWPADECTLGAVDVENPATAIGFDPLTWNVVLPLPNGDLMSYADRRWTSEFTWRGVLDYLLVHFGLQDAKPGHHVTPEGLAGPQGQPQGPVLLVQGFVDLQKNTGTLQPAYSLPDGTIAPGLLAELSAAAAFLPQDWPYHIQVSGDNAAVLVDQPAPALPWPDEDGANLLQFLFPLPSPASARRLRLLNGQTTLAETNISLQAPTLTLNAPRIDDATKTLNLSWRAADADGDPLTFAVQYSPDDGQSWLSIAVGLGETNISVPTELLPGGASARLRVITSDGYYTAIAASDSFAIQKHAPTVQIKGVNQGQEVPFGTPLLLSGFGYDAEDGSLDSPALLWDLSGPDVRGGVGSPLRWTDLAPGNYTLTLTGTDSDGQQGTQSVRFRVRPLSVADGEEPVLDGLCADPGYAQNPTVRLPNGNGTRATVHMVHANGAWFLCFVGLPYGAPNGPAKTVGLRLHTGGDTGNVPGPNDADFAVDENGQTYRFAGDGKGFAAQTTPPPGFAVVIFRDENFWSAEMRIADRLVRGWNHAIGFALLNGNLSPDTPPNIWPPGADANNPSTWSPSQAGPLPPPIDLPPIANAGPPQTRSVDPGDRVFLSGTGSYDPEGSAITYQWTQTAGPTVALDNPSGVTPAFAAPYACARVSLTFQLVVNDGQQDSAPATTPVILLLPGAPGGTNPLALAQQPMDQTNDVCKSATFAVAVNGPATPRFQWRLDGVSLTNDAYFSGADTGSLVIRPLLYTHEGNYDVLVTDYCGSGGAVTSQVAKLTIKPGLQWIFRTTNGPAARFGHALAYDRSRQVTVLFGGGQIGPQGLGFQPFGDLWEWNDGQWNQRIGLTSTSGWSRVQSTGGWVPAYADVPVPRLQHALAFDSRRGRVVLFGGRSTDPNGFDTFLGDTWEWDGSRWYFRATNGPTARIGHAMAYDSDRGVTVLYGGFFSTPPQDRGAVWEWDATAWTRHDPTNGPSTTYNQDGGAMVYDTFHHATFFGPATESFANPFWNWDGVTWTQAGPGFPRGYGAMVFDSHRRRSVFFGGNFVNLQNQTASWDGRAWTFLNNSATVPPARMSLGMAYDSDRHITLMMGGQIANRGTNDTWELIALDKPLIDQPPASQYRQLGDTVEFSVSAVGPLGAAMTYAWYFQGQPLADGGLDGRISGATSPTLRIAKVTAAEAGLYTVQVSNACGTTKSRPAALTLAVRLQISYANNILTIRWSAPDFALQQADAVTGPWSVVPGAMSPLDVSAPGSAKFYRLIKGNP